MDGGSGNGIRLAGERAARLTDVFVRSIVVIVHATEHVHERPALLWILSSWAKYAICSFQKISQSRNGLKLKILGKPSYPLGYRGAIPKYQFRPGIKSHIFLNPITQWQFYQ
ncbi:J domain-containing protein spf31 [Fusarium oxysporum f. sp. albedinis]|nr:J domain-containing protein spf31 [Fusarium oxysporum f. sp. albedinis]